MKTRWNRNGRLTWCGAMAACAALWGPGVGHSNAAPITPNETWVHRQAGTYINNDGDTKRYRTIYHVPDNPVGLVYVLHAGGGGANQFTRDVEVTDILNHLTDAGFAFIAADSVQRNDNVDVVNPDARPEPGRGVSRWDKAPTTADYENRDFDRLFRMRNQLIKHEGDKGLSHETPLFAFGMSSGANFSYTMAHMAEQRPNVPDLTAIGFYNGKLDPEKHPVIAQGVLINTPTFLVTGENDDPHTRIPGLVITHEKLERAGVPTEFHLTLEQPITPDQFNRIPQVAEAGVDLSQRLFHLFVHGDPAAGIPGFLDASGARTFEDIHKTDMVLGNYDDSISDLLEDHLVDSGDVDYVRSQIETQIKVAWAMHRTSSEFADQQVQFFLDQLPAQARGQTAVPEPATLSLLALGGLALRPRRPRRVRTNA